MRLRRQILRKKSKHGTERQPACADDDPCGPSPESCTPVGIAEGGAGGRAQRTAQRHGHAQTSVMETDLQRLAVACNKAADHYCANPRDVGPETFVDIYRAMAALATMLDTQYRSAPVLQKRLH